ncbi:cation:proton antiporter [Nocardia sp. XZ_19_231]|uniref:cation:proton antiporter n=1 Tax=Nocardia sp. XZ_19_231 TaxID=2769252 RepID=UPI00188E8760|nr:cation:proton antiporter [Nocardia sp. XZ_19_231]
MELLASAGVGDSSPIVSLFWIALIAVVAPLLSRLVRGYLPDVVILLVAGAVVGPHVLGWASSAGGVDLVSELGLGMLFLLAGYELDPQLLRGRSGHTAWIVWMVCLVFAFAIVAVAADRSTGTRVAVAIALTSTALGTLIPILKQSGIVDSALGRAVMTHGAVGELGPIVAMSVLLTSRDAGSAVVILLMFAVAALVVGFVPLRMLDRMPDLGAALGRLGGGTSQLPVRGVVLLLLVLMVMAEVFDLDVVLGAFAAGMILRRLIAAGHPDVDSSLEAIGYGLLIPVFFVVSGMGIDVEAVGRDPGLWLGFVVTIAIARGVPVWLSERFMPRGDNLPTGRERVELALYAATGLPIIVAVTQVATQTGLLKADVASILVAAGAATVLMFPLVARLIGTSEAKSVTPAHE